MHNFNFKMFGIYTVPRRFFLINPDSAWVDVAHGSRSPLVFLKSNISMQRYLQSNVLPYLNRPKC